MVRERVQKLCLMSQAIPSLELLSLPEHVFVSPITAEELKRWKEAGGVKVPSVASYAVRKIGRSAAQRGMFLLGIWRSARLSGLFTHRIVSYLLPCPSLSTSPSRYRSGSSLPLRI